MSGAAGDGGGEPFVFEDRIRFSDLDARGHLNNVRFLIFFEAARNAFVRELHPDHDPTVPTPEDLIVARAEIDYRSPGRYEEVVRTSVIAEDVDRRKFTLRFTMRAAGDDRVLAEGTNLLLGYDYDAEAPADIAEPLYAGLRRLTAGNGT